MGCTFEIAEGLKLLRATFRDTLDDTVLLESHAQARKLASLTGAQSGIADFSNVASFRVTADVLRVLAAGPAIFPAPLRSLIVSPADHIFGMARMFEILAEDTERDLCVVRTLDEAYRLLGIDSPPEFQSVNSDERDGWVGT